MIKYVFSIIFIGLGIGSILLYSGQTTQQAYYSTFTKSSKSISRKVSSNPYKIINYFNDFFFQDDSYRFLNNQIHLYYKINRKRNITLTKKLNELFKSYVLEKIKERDFDDFIPNHEFLGLFFQSLPSEFNDGTIQIQFHKSYVYNLELGSNIKNPFKKGKAINDGFTYLSNIEIPDAADTYQYLGGSISFQRKKNQLTLKRFFKINDFSQYNALLKSEDMNMDFLYFKEEQKDSTHLLTNELTFIDNKIKSYELYFGLKDQYNHYHDPNGNFFLRGTYKGQTVLMKIRGIYYDFIHEKLSNSSFFEVVSKIKPKGVIEYIFSKHKKDIFSAFDLKKVGLDDY
ncbi:MAG: hypothetical protein OEY33_09165 [Bdellovibrionales bacterium]|nr:hypothetical protein [Bdellovibrionales bacterium]